MNRRNWKNLLRRMLARRPASRTRGLLVESLEDRVNPVSVVVSTTDDLLNFPSTSEGPFSLRDAIVYSNGFAEQNLILVPEGTYTLTRGGTNEDASFTGDLDIVANGGWIEIHGAGKDKTIIDAAGIDRVFDVLPNAKLFVFDVTIRGGFASNGGGIHTRGQLAIHNSIVTGNTATVRGGGIDVNAVGIQFASQDTLYENNFAGTTATGGGQGGAINNGGGQIQINDGVFRNNRTGTQGSGGAVFTRYGSFAAITSEFDQNRSGLGGAVATNGGIANLVESAFTANRAEFSGASAAPMGGAVFGQSEVYIDRSTFAQNVAVGNGRGGALANTNYMEVVNSTISGNTAGATGQYGVAAGVYNTGGFKLIHSTVTGNRSLGFGFADGVFNNASQAAFSIYNTIVALNGSIPANNGPDTYGNFTSLGGNLIGVKAGSNGWLPSDQVGSSVAPIDPRLGPLQDNGGPTDTHALRLGSLAIDRGLGGVYQGYTGGVDQRKLPRIVNNAPDVGAYELQPRTNGAPVAAPDEYGVAEDGVLTVPTATGLLANDSDPDGDILDAELVGGPASGQLTFGATGGFTYRPAANFHGTVQFTYRAFDGALRSDPATVTIVVAPVNDAPVANNNSYSTDEDTPLQVPLPGMVGILGNDTDVDGDSLTAVLVVGPANGTLDFNDDGSFLYTPNENHHGTDSFTYKAFDGTALSAAAATVTITVRSVNDAPTATDDISYVADEDQTINGQVTGSDPDGDALTFSVATAPAWGTLNLNANGTFTYAPFKDYFGGDSFAFRVSDGKASDVASVSIVVDPVNDAPEVFDVSVRVNEDSFLADRYASFRDIDGDALTFSLLPHDNPGEFTLTPAGKFSYQPAADFNGAVVFRYKANDGQLDSNEARITIVVDPVNDAPVADSASASADEDTELSGQVTASDVDGDSLSFAVVDEPEHGTLDLNADGTYSYTPAANYHGADSFTFRANDGAEDSDLGTISIVVDPVNDAPVADSASASTDEDTELSGQVTASDVDGDSLSFAVVDEPEHGTLDLNADGTYSYTPAANYHGTDSFTFRANDGTEDSDLGTISIVVDSVKDAPSANAGADFAIDEGATASFTGSASDPDGDTLTYSWNFGDGASGSGASPTHRYAESGNYTVTLTVSDGSLSSSDSLVLTVRNVAPTASVTGPAASVPGQTVSFTFSASDPSAGDIAAGFAYEIAWGDGQSETVNGPASGVTRTHTYSAAGNRSVTVRATDRDNGTGPAASTGIAVSTANLQGGSLYIGGTTNGDTIEIRPANASGGIIVSVNGSNAGTFAPTGDIVVYGQAGADTISIATAKIGKSTVSVVRPAYLFGDDGNDTINAAGSGVGVVAVGGLGSDSITGTSGRDLLIGGAGADTIRGGDGEDILIGGFTDFDGDLQALRALRAEWIRTDISLSARVAHLRGGSGGLNQFRFLTASTVHDDDATDTLYGEGGTDWFFARKTATADSLPADKSSEVFTWV